MEFTPAFFDPLEAGGVAEGDTVIFGTGTAPGDVYVYSKKVILALNVAMATRRPLLVSGEPGSGKTTLAVNAAKALGWSLFKDTVTSRTKASDLLWTYDLLQRLNDTHEGATLRDRRHYVQPGKLWWGLDPVTAPHRGSSEKLESPAQALNRDLPPGVVDDPSSGAIVLLDEIDKADPDVPNDLLEPFDIGSFTVKETGDEIRRTRTKLALVLTTNGERELPQAFLRRCVTLSLQDEPTEDWLVRIATKRYGTAEPRMKAVAGEVLAWRKRATAANVRRPGTAEFLDAYAVCRDLNIATPEGPAWDQVALSTLWKQDATPTS